MYFEIRYKYQFDIYVNNFRHISKPTKHAAFAGNALNNTGTIPLYNAKGPSFFNSTLATSRIPFGYVPSGAKIIIIKNTTIELKMRSLYRF